MFEQGYGTAWLDCGIIYSGQLLGTKERDGQVFLVMKPSEISEIKVYMPVKEIKQMLTDRQHKYTNEEIQKLLFG